MKAFYLVFRRQELAAGYRDTTALYRLFERNPSHYAQEEEQHAQRA
jgi:hypothetical protein